MLQNLLIMLSVIPAAHMPISCVKLTMQQSKCIQSTNTVITSLKNCIL